MFVLPQFNTVMSVDDTLLVRLMDLLDSTSASAEEAIDCLSEMCAKV